ncbi:MAG: hypothetical protein K9K30_13095 [Burkholderiaceae bacterium]|nr:hypothetical protein [Sulfuritalea sp.]MCF8176169.1 hypothetical protein [Burkholderiaceae bacterium]
MRAELVLIAVLVVGGCGTTPKPADPPLLKVALEAESDGAKRYGRGDYAVAARRFDEAARIFSSIDDTDGMARNRLHRARTELAQGRGEEALRLLEPASATGDRALAALLIKAQAQLGLGRADAAQHSLSAAAALCTANCPQLASLKLLQSRAALAGDHAGDALAAAEAALKLLQGKDEAIETANAWRLIAAARLAGGDPGGALPAARNALAIDRQLALPEKIARDWLLIGHIQRTPGHGSSQPNGADALPGSDTANAYRRALDVAEAAGLGDVAALARQALSEIITAK